MKWSQSLQYGQRSEINVNDADCGRLAVLQWRPVEIPGGLERLRLVQYNGFKLLIVYCYVYDENHISRPRLQHFQI